LYGLRTDALGQSKNRKTVRGRRGAFDLELAIAAQFGSLAMLAAIRRASSRVNNFADHDSINCFLPPNPCRVISILDAF